MPLERVTVTIEKELLDSVDGNVDGKEIRNRSQAFSELLRRALRSETLRKAIVLAGGKADPLTLVNNETILEITLNNLAQAGVEDAVIALGRGGEAVVGKVKNGEDYGLRVEYSWDEKPGTARALMKARKSLRERFVLSYSDVLFPGLDLQDMLKAHIANNSVCTIALADVQTPQGVGVAIMQGAKIIRFEEKPPKMLPSNFVNAGIAICEPTIFSYAREGMKSFEKDLLPEIAAKEKLFGYTYSGKWFHLENKRDLEEARKYLENTEK